VKTVVMCGGGGTRLWPLSRLNMPKQFAQLSSNPDDPTLFQQTLLRNADFTSEFLIVVGQSQVHLAESQAEALNLKQKMRFLAEPFGKNTASVIALACQVFGDEDHVLVVPSDHYVAHTKEYQNVILKSKTYLDQNSITLFGITPTRAETGFGYIEFKNETVISFKEKPDQKTAELYLKSGQFLWNGGIFAFKNKAMRSEFQKHLPKSLEVASRLDMTDQKTILVPEHLMHQFENISIDFGVIEKSKNLAILNASNWQWSDLGSFEALADLSSIDLSATKTPKTDLASSSSKSSKGSNQRHNIHTIDSENNFVMSQKEVVLIGLNNLVVVDTGDALLISQKGQSSKVKEILPNLSQPDLAKNHLTVIRPWGSFTVLEDGVHYKVKSIIVKPNKRLSLQKHKHRAEVWTVVKGVATVTIDDKTFDLKVNETCFIPLGSVHRLTNSTSTDVEIIETQTGQSFDESDIIRLEDDFNRV
jgi:mannose-1-phosphate guanylyltransferase